MGGHVEALDLVTALTTGKVNNVPFLRADQRSQLPVSEKKSDETWLRRDIWTRNILGANGDAIVLASALGDDGVCWVVPVGD